MKSKENKPKKKILILSATAGAGHVRAGEALEETARDFSLPVTLLHEDILNFTFPLFKKLYNDLYFGLVNASPELWGYLYKKTNLTRKKKSPLLKLFDHFNYKKYLETLHLLRPDAVVCTHFLPYAAIAGELTKRGWSIPFFVSTTDFDVHSLWIAPGIMHYYAATDESAWTIRSHGIDEFRISVTGIPIRSHFGIKVDQTGARKQLGLSTNKFTIMILSGGYGIGVLDDLVASIADFLGTYKKKQFQLLIVCGKNQALYDSLRRYRFPQNVTPVLFKFVPFINQLMDCSELLITKSGGLTVSEALAKHLPMIIFDPIPGQEGRNAEYLTEQGAAMRAFSFQNLHYKLKMLIDNPERLRSMRGNAGTIAKPNAAHAIMLDVLKRI